MVSDEEVEDILPYAVKMEINCDPDVFRLAVGDSFGKLLEEHHEKYGTKIEHIARFYVGSNYDGFECGEYRIYVGRDLVLKGTGPDPCEETSERLQAFYRTIVSITESVLDTWHDRIIEVQEDNKTELERLEEEGYDEMLYAYYSLHQDRKAFLYLKRLALRYPHSKYMDRLYKAYRKGRYGRRRNASMCIKLRQKEYVHDYF